MTVEKKPLPAIPAKRYFTIGEVSELCGVKAYVLRYWEQEFAQLKPMKRRGNRRYYQHHEVLLIRRIRDLLYEQGFTISGARNRLAELGHGHARSHEAEHDASEFPEPDEFEAGEPPHDASPVADGRPPVATGAGILDGAKQAVAREAATSSAFAVDSVARAHLNLQSPIPYLREELLAIRDLLAD